MLETCSSYVSGKSSFGSSDPPLPLCWCVWHAVTGSLYKPARPSRSIAFTVSLSVITYVSSPSRHCSIVDYSGLASLWIFSVRSVIVVLFFCGLVDYIFLFHRRVSDIISALSTRVSSLSLVNEQLNEHSMLNIEKQTVSAVWCKEKRQRIYRHLGASFCVSCHLI